MLLRCDSPSAGFFDCGSRECLDQGGIAVLALRVRLDASLLESASLC